MDRMKVMKLILACVICLGIIVGVALLIQLIAK
jgi:hypothetical protein